MYLAINPSPMPNNTSRILEKGKVNFIIVGTEHVWVWTAAEIRQNTTSLQRAQLLQCKLNGWHVHPGTDIDCQLVMAGYHAVFARE